MRQAASGHGTTRRVGPEGADSAANRNMSVTARPVALIPTPLLTGLPDLEYFAVLDRAQLYKGRLPILVP